MFILPTGTACIVSWSLPEPGLRVFSPEARRPEGVDECLPYALFLSAHLQASRVTIDMDDGIEWNSDWGELRDWTIQA